MNSEDVTNIPDKNSQSADWVAWYNALLGEFSTIDSNSLFLKAWHNRGNSNSNSHELRTLLSSHGINIDTGLLSSAYDTAAGIGNDITGAIGSVFGFGKKLVYIVVGGGVLTLVVVIYVAVKHPKAVVTLAKAAI